MLVALYPVIEEGSATRAATWPADIVIAKVCSQLLITSEEKGREFTLNGIILLETDSLLKVFKFQEPPSDL